MDVKKAAKKIISGFILPVILFTGAFLIQGCATPDNYERSYLNIITHFGKNGLKVTRVQPLNHLVVGAESAFSFKIGPREIGLYKYNPKLKKHRVRMERVDKTGSFYVVGNKFAAIRNGCFIMIAHETHPDRTQIEKAFKTFR